MFASKVGPTTFINIFGWQSCSVHPAFKYATDTFDFAESERQTWLNKQRPANINVKICLVTYNVRLQLLVQWLVAATGSNDSWL